MIKLGQRGKVATRRNEFSFIVNDKIKVKFKRM